MWPVLKHELLQACNPFNESLHAMVQQWLHTMEEKTLKLNATTLDLERKIANFHLWGCGYPLWDLPVVVMRNSNLCSLLLKHETAHVISSLSRFYRSSCNADILVADILIVSVWHVVGWKFIVKSWLIGHHIQKALCHWRLSTVKMISCSWGDNSLTNSAQHSTAQDVHVTSLSSVQDLQIQPPNI